MSKKRNKNIYRNNKDGTTSIFINSIKYGVKEILIDTNMYSMINKYAWSLSKSSKGIFYARSNYVKKGKLVAISMHRLITGAKCNQLFDHMDLNGLNNTSNNLRECSKSQNNMNRGKQKNNTSGYKGVYKYTQKQGLYIYSSWGAVIIVDRKRIFLGYFKTAKLAHIAYCSAAKKYHSKFARVA